MSSNSSKIFPAVKGAFFAILLAIILFLIVISDGRILDLRIATDQNSKTFLAISLACWSALLAFIYKGFFGGWKSNETLNSSLLLTILLLPMLLIVLTFLPAEAPKLAKALLVGGCALIAGIIVDRLIGRRRRRDIG